MGDESPLLLYPPLGLLRDPPWESSGAYTEAMYVPFQGPVVLMGVGLAVMMRAEARIAAQMSAEQRVALWKR